MKHTAMTEQRMSPREAEGSSPMNQRAIATPSLPHMRLGALVAAGLAAFLVGWVAVNRGDDGTVTAGTATSASASKLKEFAAGQTHPVYWAGPKDGYTYELTQTTNGSVYVRYLPKGTEVGDPRAQFLTIGTYPRPQAFAELQRVSKAKGAVTVKLERGGIAVYSEARPTSVYFGYPDGRYQVEVYNPSAAEARRLALSGQVVPVR